ncbi:hypothetical protein TNCT_300041 [Trichonephila clavata]|uniref:Uncharacterized protein n=1 Tax=Trichonephila clavata TaxID=2740835 RepID=A0A8X6EYU5_TRICU|nr:hypothetical protein TNCT_300041 [Trichonephila clavata]
MLLNQYHEVVQYRFKKAGFEIPVLSTLTDENKSLELVKTCGSSQMQEYLEIEEDLCTEDSNNGTKSFISTVASTKRD